MSQTLTISLPDDVYQDLQSRVGTEDMNRFVANLIRVHVTTVEDLDAAYREMAADEEREREAREWLEADLGEELE